MNFNNTPSVPMGHEFATPWNGTKIQEWWRQYNRVDDIKREKTLQSLDGQK